jgi:hypothetical protein
MRCRNGVTEKLLSVTDATAVHSPKHPRDCVRRASGLVLTIHPELAYRGREADFPPGSQNLGSEARMWALLEVWGGAEGAKLLIGALLAGYMFTYKSRRRSHRAAERLDHAADAQGFVNQRQ